jgi:esterase FrsA
MEYAGRTLEGIRSEIVNRAGRINPFEWVNREDVSEVAGRLGSLDPDHWGKEWARIAARYEARGDEEQTRGQSQACGESFYLAYEYYRIGRYPVPDTTEKMTCYQGALRCFHKAAKYLDPPAERVEIPFEGKTVVGYLQLPRGAARPPVVMHWGGVDGWKEDRRQASEAFHKEGLATFAIDMPGTGENPVLGGDPRAERTFSAALDHLEKRSDVDGSRVAVMGASFGGYWATKVAYVEWRRLRGAVNWGAGVHLSFLEQWLRPALTQRASQYLLGPKSLFEARSYMFRAKTLEEVLSLAPKLSLKDQGFLEKPNAPLLLVNGKKDDQHPIDDVYMLMEHGDPKEVRIYPEGGHMGREPGKSNQHVLELITRWVKRKLS